VCPAVQTVSSGTSDVAARRRTDGELLSAVDDDSAWAELVERYGRLVWSVVRSFRLDSDRAADVSQTVWMRLVENRERIRDPGKLASWLATSARNEAISALRSHRREWSMASVADSTDPTAIPVDDHVVDLIHDAQLRADLRAAFSRLPSASRQLLSLVTAEPRLEYAVIAHILGRPVGSIGPTRARCLVQLRTELARIRAQQ
jgi:RNA polymerase sigma factor (sigma-70 family)